MRGKAYSSAFFTLFLMCIVICDSFPQIYDNNSDLIPSLIRHFNIHYVGFFKSDGVEHYRYVEAQKSITQSRRLLYTSVWSYGDIVKFLQKGSVSNTDSLVILYLNGSSYIQDDLVRVSHEVDISPLKWLLITDDYNLKDYENMRIPLNCEFIIAKGSESDGYDLVEVYEVMTVKKIVNHVGTWSANDGLEMTQLKLVQRRKDLQGTLFNVSSNHENPCSVQSFENAAGTVLVCIHFRLFPIIARMYNFSINWIVQTRTRYGSSFSLKDLSQTIQFTTFEINSNFESDISVIWPTVRTLIEIYTSYTGRALEWSTFIDPFSKQMWLAIFIWVVLSAGLSSGADFLTLNLQKKRKKTLFFKMWLRHVFVSFSAFCYQCEGNTPEKTSQRILQYLVFLIPTALIPGYSAALTSFLAIKLETAPFTSLEGLSKAKDYKLGYQTDTDDEVISALFRDIIVPQNELPAVESEGLRRMCKEKYSYLCTVHTVAAVPPPCSFYKLDKPVISAFSFMPIKYGSPYKYFMDRSLREIAFKGVLQIEANRVLPPTVTDPASDENEIKLEPITVENVITIIVGLGFGIAISVILLLAEFAFFRWSHPQ